MIPRWNHGSAGRVGYLIVLCILLAVISGCMYPENQMKQSGGAPKEAVRTVQAAIDQYQAETSLLPIENSASDTPLYEKFKIDFGKLQRAGYLSSIPGAAFENGGNYYFLLIDEETKPRVKLLDLVTFQQMNDLASWIKEYQAANNDGLPLGEQAYPGFYRVDYAKLNKQEQKIRSIYSGQTLTAMIDEQGNVYTDYGLDIMRAVDKLEDKELDPALDLRTLLVDQSEFVPVKAPVYHWVNNEPTAVIAK
ncbi:hypothetical protein ACFO9Q_12215 [Paenibacillus sp. GCM10023252]|uniref:hypothetical protein n=1 Tax=Paenibacillus sp. GCM10023252 TaxID=3252649 RepID=UPI0036062107